MLITLQAGANVINTVDGVRKLLPEMTSAVEAGRIAASTAARNLLLALENTA